MTRILLPAVLLIASGALFLFFTDDTYQRAKVLRAEAGEYDEALTRSRELQEVRNRLLSRYNAFAPENVRKLERLLPDHVDNIRLILDIDNIAARYNLRIRNVSIKETAEGRAERSALAVGAGGDAVGSVSLGFSVTATYQDFVRFLKDLEKSLRIVDVTDISMKVGEGDLHEYNLSIRTYWLH